MTKGQTEFVIAMGVIIVALAAAVVILYETHSAVTKPQHTIVYTQPSDSANTVLINSAPTTNTVLPIIISVPVQNCDVLKSIHIAMTKAEVVNICGNPERIDDSSAEVKRVERVFKHDEIWYYDKQSETVELTNDIVTAIHPTLPQALPLVHK